MQDSTGNSPRQDLTGLRILLVDDSVDNQRLFSLYLKKAGAGVTLAGNGQEGVATALKAQNDGQPFDIILMDMQMPVMDGFTATQTLRDRGVQTPIVALTGNAIEEDQDQYEAAGFTDYLTKPILRDDLLAGVVKASQGRS